MEKELRWESQSFGKRLKSMLKVDFRRMFTMPLFYIMAGTCLVIPVLILVMTTMVGGADPNAAAGMSAAGTEAAADMFENTWQIIGTISGEGSAMAMDMTSMCNINLLYFFAAVFVCLFVTEDFKSGYTKNLFAVRPKKGDYVISKTLAGFLCCACMILAFFIGSVLGGAIAGLPFDAGVAGSSGIAMCLLSKILLMAVFVPIYLFMGLIAKQKTWLAMTGSFCTGMLFFMMIPMLTPLNAGIGNVIGCLIGGVLFSLGFGALSSQVLKRTSLV